MTATVVMTSAALIKKKNCLELLWPFCMCFFDVLKMFVCFICLVEENPAEDTEYRGDLPMVLDLKEVLPVYDHHLPLA